MKRNHRNCAMRAHCMHPNDNLTREESILPYPKRSLPPVNDLTHPLNTNLPPPEPDANGNFKALDFHFHRKENVAKKKKNLRTVSFVIHPLGTQRFFPNQRTYVCICIVPFFGSICCICERGFNYNSNLYTYYAMLNNL